MILELTDEEREFLLRGLKSFLSDLRAQITHTDSPQFKGRLKHDEQTLKGLIEKLGSS